MNHSILCKGVLSTPLPEYQVISAKAPEQPVQAAAPAAPANTGATKGAGAGADSEAPQHEYLRCVQQLVDNLGMNRPDAERKVQDHYPKLYKSFVDESFAEQDRQIEEALKGKALSPAAGALIAETREAHAAHRFVVAVQARAASGSLGQAIEAVVAADPAGHRAWVSRRCQPGL